jgi:uncharacterized membrane protein
MSLQTRMMWLGLFAGIAIGALAWGYSGAVVLGFLGWLAGVIIGSIRSKPAPAKAPPAAAAQPVDRVRMLEARVATLEARLAKLEGIAPPEPMVAVATPESTPPAVEPPVAVVAPAETVVPQAAPQPEPETERGEPNRLVAWLTGGNTIARAGLVILFLGLAFLLKWAADHASLPPIVRVGGVALVGLVLLALGWRLRERRAGYALGLQGAGVAVLYLVTFAALRLYNLIGPGTAFAMLAAIAVASGVLAVTQDALILAAFGAGGGFLAPILASTGEGSHVVLFGYYMLLNLGIAGIAFFRSWRSLNIVGFVFTFVIGTVWGYRFYAPEYLRTTEPFLVAFFVLYLAITVIQAIRLAPARVPYVDGILVFGVPIAAFGLQAALMADVEYGLAWSSAAAAVVYLALAAALRLRDNVRMLVECFLALGIVFATLTIPLALDARWTSALWALEGAAVAWIGVRQQRRVATGLGLLMQLLAGGAFVVAYFESTSGSGWLDAIFLGALVLAAAGLWTSRLLERAPWALASGPAGALYFVWGFAWLLAAAQYDLDGNIESSRHQVEIWVALYPALAALMLALRRYANWRRAAWPSYVFVPAMVVLALATLAETPHPFTATAAPAWAFALAAHIGILRGHTTAAPRRWIEVEHLWGALLFVMLATVDLHYWAVLESARRSAWIPASLVVPGALLLLAVAARTMDDRWPVATHVSAYRIGLPTVMAILFGLWIVYANIGNDGRSDPLPYLPLLNALDLAHVLAGAALAATMLSLRRRGVGVAVDLQRRGPAVAAAFAFLWLNFVLLRTLHHWAGIPYRLHPLMESTLVQASLSIFWSLLALALMVVANRRASRAIWLTGAALMAIVVVKLFVVELAQVGAIERIVSFIVVGVLMLAIGYLAPVPPRAPAKTAP